MALGEVRRDEGRSEVPYNENKKRSMPWYVYIIRCRDKTLYTGITNNLSSRIKAHNSGKGGRYTRCRFPVKLIHSEESPGKSEAQKREARIKSLTREEKLQLCREWVGTF